MKKKPVVCCNRWRTKATDQPSSPDETQNRGNGMRCESVFIQTSNRRQTPRQTSRNRRSSRRWCGPLSRSDRRHQMKIHSTRVVQAHVIGGNRMLQARLDLWSARAPQTIQRQSKQGVEAIRVQLRPKAGGLPLPSDVRTKMETALGGDFSEVRVHIGHEATALGAIAYTWGTNI